MSLFIGGIIVKKEKNNACNGNSHQYTSHNCLYSSFCWSVAYHRYSACKYVVSTQKIAEKTGYIMKLLRKEVMLAFLADALVIIVRLIIAYTIGVLITKIVKRIFRKRTVADPTVVA